MYCFAVIIKNLKDVRIFEQLCGPIIEIETLIMRHKTDGEYIFIYKVPDGYIVERGYIAPHIYPSMLVKLLNL